MIPYIQNHLDQILAIAMTLSIGYLWVQKVVNHKEWICVKDWRAKIFNIFMIIVFMFVTYYILVIKFDIFNLF